MAGELRINGVAVEDTFAEAFRLFGCRAIITAESAAWARLAAEHAAGYASSVIGCDVEAGVECEVPPTQTPDGRPGYAVLFFARHRQALEGAVVNRIGQSVLTCATTACYNGLVVVRESRIRVGGRLRYFGDSWQTSKVIDSRRYWRLPVMDGEFVCEDWFGTIEGVGGGNFLILGETLDDALRSAEAAVDAIRRVPNVICPFPGGVVRSGSKVGSRYRALKASTNEAYCPTLRSAVGSALPASVNAVYEIVIDGVDLDSVARAMSLGIRAACGKGVVAVTAANFGGNLGAYQIRLHEVLERPTTHKDTNARRMKFTPSPHQ